MPHGFAPTPLAHRILDHVTIGDGCWEWQGAKTLKGYGKILGSQRRMVTAHRAAWEVWVGDLPAQAWVLHKCDNPACIRPDHLFLGDAVSNVADMISKGRNCRGERHHRARLVTEDVLEIRRAVSLGVEQKDVARAYGLSKQMVNKIVHKIKWRHVT